jgi:hypothetical protein
MPKKIKTRHKRAAKVQYVREWLEENGLTKGFLNQQAREEGLIGPKEKLTLEALYTMAVQCRLSGRTIDNPHGVKEDEG